MSIRVKPHKLPSFTHYLSMFPRDMFCEEKRKDRKGKVGTRNRIYQNKKMIEPEDKAERGKSENRLQYNEKTDILSTSFDPVFIRKMGPQESQVPETMLKG